MIHVRARLPIFILAVVLVITGLVGVGFYCGAKFGGSCEDGVEVLIVGPRETVEAIDGEAGHVIMELEFARDIHESYLQRPPDPTTGSYSWHERWIEVYEKAISLLVEHERLGDLPE